MEFWKTSKKRRAIDMVELQYSRGNLWESVVNYCADKLSSFFLWFLFTLILKDTKFYSLGRLWYDTTNHHGDMWLTEYSRRTSFGNLEESLYRVILLMQFQHVSNIITIMELINFPHRISIIFHYFSCNMLLERGGKFLTH